MPHLVFIGTLLANPALAEDGPTVAVVGMHQADLDADAQSEASERLVEALAGTGAVQALSPDAFARAIAGREAVIVEEALLAKGRDLLSTGKSSFNNALDEEAVYNLEAAVESLTAAISGTNTTRDLWEAWIYLAATRMNLGAEDKAEAAFAQAAALDLDRHLDEAFWAPSVVSAYRDIAARMSELGATVAVTSSGPGTVWLDGVERGALPLTLDGVLPGEHHVVVRGSGRQGYERFTVPEEQGGAKIKLQLSLGPPTLITSSTNATARSDEAGLLYRTIGRHTQEVDLILMAGSDESNLLLQLYDLRTESFSKGFEIPVVASNPVGQAADNIGTLINRLDADGLLPPAQRDTRAVGLAIDDNELLARMLTQPAPSPIGPGVSSTTTGPSQRRKGTVWAIVGASIGVAALTTGGVLIGTGAFGSADDGPAYDGTVVIGPF
jgi:tetratricopeptide (TPR) repeat protein